jgi:diacylglycerol kinase (ATP)
MAERLYVIFNPQAGKGRGARLVRPLLDALSSADVEHAGEAIARGHRTIVAVGGDGTWSNVGIAILRSGKAVRLGLVPGGTGCDLARSLHIPQRLDACARVILGGQTRQVDAGRIEDRYFLNIAGFGYDVAVLEDSWSVRHLRGELLYLYCALRQLRSFPGFRVQIEADGRAPAQRELLMFIVANARVFGGGFRIAPWADMADGRLEGVAFANMGLPRRLGAIVQLLMGTHRANRRVEVMSAGRYRLRFEAPPAYEADGEWNRATSSELSIEVLPSALSVLVPEPAIVGLPQRAAAEIA